MAPVLWAPVGDSVRDAGGDFASPTEASVGALPRHQLQSHSSLPNIRHQRASEPLSPFSAFSPDSQYWIYDGERRVSGPTPIVELGLPASPVQAALVWGAEKNKIYIFSGGSYWRFNPHTRWVDNIYPRTMADWRGVPQEIDAAFQDEFGQCSRDMASSGEGAQAETTAWWEELGRFGYFREVDASQPQHMPCSVLRGRQLPPVRN